MSHRRRSSRISDKQSQIPLIVISSSEDEQAPLPIQQAFIADDTEGDESPPQIECILPPTPRPSSSRPVRRRHSSPGLISQRQQASSPKPQSQPYALATSRSPSPQSSSTKNRSHGKVVKKRARTPRVKASPKTPRTPKQSDRSTSHRTPKSSQRSRHRLSSSSSYGGDDGDEESESADSPFASANESVLTPHKSVENRTPSLSTAIVPVQQPARSQAGTMTDEEMIERARARRLIVEEIGGAVNDNNVELVVKWKGVDDLERIPMKHMRVLFPQHVVEFLCSKIKWTNDYQRVPLSQGS